MAEVIGFRRAHINNNNNNNDDDDDDDDNNNNKNDINNKKNIKEKDASTTFLLWRVIFEDCASSA